NTIALRSQVDETLPFRTYLKNIKALVLDAYSNQEVPFEMLTDKLQVDRNTSYSPIFQVMLAYNNTPITDITMEGLTLQQLPIETKSSKLDLTLELWESPTGLQGRFEFDSELFNTETLVQMRTNFITLLENISAHPEKHINELEMFTTDD